MPRSVRPFVFLQGTAPTEIYTLSLHDALPICGRYDYPSRSYLFPSNPTKMLSTVLGRGIVPASDPRLLYETPPDLAQRSEEHTSELQSRRDLVCRLLLEKKKQKTDDIVSQMAV